MDACQMTSDIMNDEKFALCTFCTICTIAGESAESANSAMQKNKSKKDQAVSEPDPWNRGMSEYNSDGMDGDYFIIFPSVSYTCSPRRMKIC